MTSRLLEPEAATRPPRLGALSGAALGVVVAAILTWLADVGWTRFLRAGQESDGASMAFAALIFMGMGLVLWLVGLGGRAHPLVPGVPALWFGVLFLPSIVGFLTIPGWYPDPLSSLALGAQSPAVYLMLGYLLLATVTSAVQRRRSRIFR